MDISITENTTPMDQVQHRTITVPPVEEIPEEPTFWEQVQDFFEGLFA